jgi:hypothetical protein
MQDISEAIAHLNLPHTFAETERFHHTLPVVFGAALFFARKLILLPKRLIRRLCERHQTISQRSSSVQLVA